MRIRSVISHSAQAVLEGALISLLVVGLLAVEMFLLPGEEILINELAPRPHNSGHFSFDASVTSQFEQQLRAVCGLPLGSPELLRPAAMANLLGDLWSEGEPDWCAAAAMPEVKIHLYGKSEPRVGRKMGGTGRSGVLPELVSDALDQPLHHESIPQVRYEGSGVHAPEEQVLGMDQGAEPPGGDVG